MGNSKNIPATFSVCYLEVSDKNIFLTYFAKPSSFMHKN
jgi:hypothetical protein